MAGVEGVALDAGRWLLTLDTATATADAERLYQRLGWILAGVIPRFALNPDRTLTENVVVLEGACAFPTGRVRADRGPKGPLRTKLVGHLLCRQPGSGAQWLALLRASLDGRPTWFVSRSDDV